MKTLQRKPGYLSRASLTSIPSTITYERFPRQTRLTSCQHLMSVVLLLEKGKQLLAVKFIMYFGLKEKFPPMPLIESHVDDALKVAQNARHGGIDSRKAQNVAWSRELRTLKSAIKVIREHKLELEHPTKDLEARIQLLQESYPPTAVANAYIPSSYMTSTPEPYHLVSSASTVASYPDPSNGLYGAASAPASYSCEPNPVQHYVYPSQSQTSSLYYDRPNSYGGYAYPSHYYQSYYPQ